MRRAPSPPVRGRLDERALLENLRESVFRPGPGGEGLRVGAEVELIPVDSETGRVLPIHDPGGRGSGDLLREHGAALGWVPGTTATGAPAFRLPDGSLFSFEPGGQIELSSPACHSVDELVALLHGHLGPLVGVAVDRGIGLVCRGLDPLNPVEGAVLQVTGERYTRQARHYERRGSWGRRMMRQGAAIHVNVDLGPCPRSAWEVANAAAPAWIAIFANSSRMEGRDAGLRSARAAQWRLLDPTRTGAFVPGGDPAEVYLRFALEAEAFLEGTGDAPAEPFGTWLTLGTDLDAWGRHLSTLFPEVRPRGYLELRSFDALPPRWYAAPLALVVGLLHDAEARECARALLPPPTPEALEVAGRLGLRDASLAAIARDMAELALEGAERQERMVGGRSLDVARAFVDTFTRRGLDPGDEPGDRVTQLTAGPSSSLLHG